jgi:translation initiation factor IF-2
MPEAKVGVVTHFFGKVGVAIVQATDGAISVGDTIHIKGVHTDHTQTIESLQSEHEQIQRIEPGKDGGIKVGCHAHEHDVVYKVTA